MKPPGASQIQLRVNDGAGEGRMEHELAGPVIQVGRGPGNDLVFADPRVSAIHGRMRRAVEAGHFQDIVYQYEHKGDYVRVVVYVEDGARWAPTADTRVVFCYGDVEVESLELIFMSFDESTRDAARTVLSSRMGVVIDPAQTGLARSGDGGFRGYLRFPPGSLPRPVRTWFGLVGGNRWGLVRPDRALATEGGTADAADPDPSGSPRAGDGADGGLDHAGR